MIVASLLGASVFLLICGIIRLSYKNFAAMMCGEERKRGVPLIWCFCIECTVPCAGPRWKARSKEDQRSLKEKWSAMGRRKRVDLWVKWGFKWKYPVELLGEEPDRLNKSWRKQQNEQIQDTTGGVKTEDVAKERV